MSARALSWAWQQVGQEDLPAAAKLVLLRLADRSDPEGKCWPGHQRTAADLQLSETSVKNAIRLLEGSGLIKVSPQKIGGRDMTNVYILQISGEGANSAPRGAKNGAGEGANSAPESKDKNRPKERARGGARAAGGQAPPRPPRSRRGGFQFEVDQQTGIHHFPNDPSDAQALERIKQHKATAVREAVEAASELDDKGRAFPSAVLRQLLRLRGRDKQPVGTGMTGMERLAAIKLARAGSCSAVIEGEAKWTD